MDREVGLIPESELVQRIVELKRRHDVMLLAHNYQRPEVRAVADFTGDSLELSRIAARTEAARIVFCGVLFMAETAKILSPQKRVFLPRLDAGCPMADMITAGELREWKGRFPGAPVVTYVNSSAEVKAESDICCTSANAAAVVRSLSAPLVLFAPDQNLASWVQEQVPEKKVVPYDGFCYVHHRIRGDEIAAAKLLHPRAVVLAHPETRSEVRQLADQVLSTSGMLRFARHSEAQEFIIVTEEGLLPTLVAENPGKEFFHPGPPRLCSNMKKTTLRDVVASLAHERYEIDVARPVQERALSALERMIAIS